MIRLSVLYFFFLNELKKKKSKKTTFHDSPNGRSGNELDAACSIVFVPLIIVDELFVVIVFLVSRNAVD